jgi:hypothetical protein
MRLSVFASSRTRFQLQATATVASRRLAATTRIGCAMIQRERESRMR